MRKQRYKALIFLVLILEIAFDIFHQEREIIKIAEAADLGNNISQDSVPLKRTVTIENLPASYDKSLLLKRGRRIPVALSYIDSEYPTPYSTPYSYSYLNFRI
jgi:hypothetical protein